MVDIDDHDLRRIMDDYARRAERLSGKSAAGNLIGLERNLHWDLPGNLEGDDTSRLTDFVNGLHQ
jgi:hypothetical protein